MKLTKETLKRIIKEELEAVMSEDVGVGQKTNDGSSRTQAQGKFTPSEFKKLKKEAARAAKLAQAKGAEGIIDRAEADEELAEAADAAAKEVYQSKGETDIKTAAMSMGNFYKKKGFSDAQAEVAVSSAFYKTYWPMIQRQAKADADIASEKDQGIIGSRLKHRAVPFLLKSAKYYWKKSGSSSVEEFTKELKDIQNMTNNRDIAKYNDAIKKLLGDSLYKELMDAKKMDRSVFQKLKNKFRGGAFAQE